MESDTFKSMSIEDLWTLREQVAAILANKIVAEQARLEALLRKIVNASNVVRPNHRRP